MRRFLSILNHELLEEQKREIEAVLQCSSIITLPGELKQIWEQMPAAGDLSTILLNRMTGFLEEFALPGDYVLVQGDFGATYYIVDFCFHHGFIPVYSTSLRQYSEATKDGGFIERRHLYRHVAFRKYKPWEG